MSLKTKPSKRLIGYARVSTQQQDLARQTKALKLLGCAVIYSDTASGKSMAGRPQLACALDDLDTGDEFVIAEWDRATRSMWDGLQIIKAVIDAGAAIKVLDRSYIDLATPMGRGFMAMMSAMAEDERLRIIKRTHEGRQIARAKGVSMACAFFSVPPASRLMRRRPHGARRASLRRADRPYCGRRASSQAPRRRGGRGYVGADSPGTGRITAPGSSWPHSTRIVQRKRRLFTKAQVLLTAFVLGLEPLNSDRTISASRGTPRLVQRIYIDLAYGETLSPPPPAELGSQKLFPGGASLERTRL